MKKLLLLFFVVIILIVIIVFRQKSPLTIISSPLSPNPTYSPQEIPPQMLLAEKVKLKNWKRPKVPLKVGLQVGHWKRQEAPDELKKLRNIEGAYYGDLTEADVMLAIATDTAKLLRDNHIQVDVLPATLPQSYQADAFVALHADFSKNEDISGFKLASPPHDMSGKASLLKNDLYSTYKSQTKLKVDNNISPEMKYYYAFSWWRFNHSLHPMTPGVILETGYLTNSDDRSIIVDQPDIAAKAIANGIEKFLKTR